MQILLTAVRLQGGVLDLDFDVYARGLWVLLGDAAWWCRLVVPLGRLGPLPYTFSLEHQPTQARRRGRIRGRKQARTDPRCQGRVCLRGLLQAGACPAHECAAGARCKNDHDALTNASANRQSVVSWNIADLGNDLQAHTAEQREGLRRLEWLWVIVDAATVPTALMDSSFRIRCHGLVLMAPCAAADELETGGLSVMQQMPSPPAPRSPSHSPPRIWAGKAADRSRKTRASEQAQASAVVFASPAPRECPIGRLGAGKQSVWNATRNSTRTMDFGRGNRVRLGVGNTPDTRFMILLHGLLHGCVA
ncbi:uncharacterized protein BJ171DRAFT_511126 [Polychytrium aggregatum]|uniref:uncharacterized protein n=1 Tax=Polychytrium aggregatum TaxID=110093 RepID=UPI0022FF2C38|nr:uncharacterized protein BJ171DRAFT_511126 [Polychytrium aggregatum]KAI9203203.1 hypothetical protein BJ171DRAFT_511126 [Polychytrium aggregatum]